ncbi:hypothetical protein MRS44_000264 [Fusarium solani]|uniref:uncharacterized protein n=1 Tax=Fusarium solani TaxID=169388 RepID=UPI0032C49B29|nr:hypothetical protein MRS44_000264 [Fusarium solani]
MPFSSSNQEGSNNMSRELPAWMQPSGEPDWSSRNNPWGTSHSGAPTKSPPRPDNPHPLELTLRPLVLGAAESPSPNVSSAAESLLLLALDAVGSLAQQAPTATKSLTEESGIESEGSVEEVSRHAKGQIKWTAIDDQDIHMAEASAVDEDTVEALADDGEYQMDEEASNDEDMAEAPANDGEGPLGEEER